MSRPLRLRHSISSRLVLPKSIRRFSKSLKGTTGTVRFSYEKGQSPRSVPLDAGGYVLPEASFEQPRTACQTDVVGPVRGPQPRLGFFKSLQISLTYPFDERHRPTPTL